MKISFPLAIGMLMATLAIPARAQQVPLVPSPTLTRLDALFADAANPQNPRLTRQERISAFAGLRRPNLEIEDFLKNKLARDEFWQNHDDEGASRLALNLIAILRLGAGRNSGFTGDDYVEPGSIVGLLARHLTFRIDSKSVPVGVDYTPVGYTPVVVALMEIDGPRVRRAIVDVLAQSTDANERICALFVLKSTLGDLTLPLLEEKNRRFKARGEIAAFDSALALWPDLNTKFANFAWTGDGEKPRFQATPETSTPIPALPQAPITLPESTKFRRGIERPKRPNPFLPTPRRAISSLTTAPNR